MDVLQARAPQGDGEIAGQFDDAIRQLESAPKKARKKIPQDTVPRLQADKTRTVSAERQGRQVSGSGAETGRAGQRHGRTQVDRSAFTRMASAVTEAGQVPGTYSPPPFPSMHEGEVASRLDRDGVQTELARTQSQGGMLRSAVSQMMTDQRKQVTANQQLSAEASGVGREMAQVTQELTATTQRRMQQTSAANSLMQASQSVFAAAVNLEKVAGTLASIADALMIIPIVGWSLGAAITAVAMALKGVAKGLVKTGTQLAEKGGRTLVEATQTQMVEQQLAERRALLGVRRQQLNARLQMGKQRLTRIERSLGQAQKAWDDNVRRQQDLTARIEGRGATADTRAFAAAPSPRTIPVYEHDENAQGSLEARLALRLQASPREGPVDALERRADQRVMSLLLDAAADSPHVRPETRAAARVQVDASPDGARGSGATPTRGGVAA